MKRIKENREWELYTEKAGFNVKFFFYTKNDGDVRLTSPDYVIQDDVMLIPNIEAQWQHFLNTPSQKFPEYKTTIDDKWNEGIEKLKDLPTSFDISI